MTAKDRIGGKVLRRSHPARAWRRVIRLSLSILLPCQAAAAASPDPGTRLDQAMAGAESSLREGELQVAESRYRSALLEGWLLVGGLEASEGRLPQAEEAFRRASVSAVETRRALYALALVQVHRGKAAEAVEVLTRVVGRDPKDLEARRLLAQARAANGQPDQAVQELEEARALAPDDLELAFLLASGYLRLKKVDAAEVLFAQIAKERPIPQTHVLIGRTYRDFGEYDRARAELRAALKQDPRVRRAHYYLGMVALLDQWSTRLEEAIAEFRQELRLAPRDPITNLRLGMALVEAQRPAEALSALELAARSASPPVEASLYLGRCRLALERPAEALTALQESLKLAHTQGGGAEQLGNIHYQLGLAFRKLGVQEDAAVHFAEAERYSAEQVHDARERLARYPAEGDQDTTSAIPPIEAPALSRLDPAGRQELRRRLNAALCRAYLNLGVMQAQGERFGRAAEQFEAAAELDADFPQVQYSLGVALFNARQFEKAAPPLAAALAKSPADANLKRMLAMAWFNSAAYAKAVDLLRDDPRRDADPSLQYAYGLALVRSGRAAEAELIFSRLLARHGDSAELSVVLGQAHAQQGDYESAIEALTRARGLKADVAGANAALGVIYLKQGRLPEAEEALRAELKNHPADVESQNTLATVLDLEGHGKEALVLLRAALKARPQFANARYLLGKILLSQGAAAEAAEHLEAAALLAPEDANIHYQLGQAYQKLGRTEQAQQQFEVFRQLKEARRGGES